MGWGWMYDRIKRQKMWEFRSKPFYDRFLEDYLFLLFDTPLKLVLKRSAFVVNIFIIKYPSFLITIASRKWISYSFSSFPRLLRFFQTADLLAMIRLVAQFAAPYAIRPIVPLRILNALYRARLDATKRRLTPIVRLNASLVAILAPLDPFHALRSIADGFAKREKRARSQDANLFVKCQRFRFSHWLVAVEELAWVWDYWWCCCLYYKAFLRIAQINRPMIIPTSFPNTRIIIIIRNRKSW